MKEQVRILLTLIIPQEDATMDGLKRTMFVTPKMGNVKSLNGSQ